MRVNADRIRKDYDDLLILKDRLEKENIQYENKYK
jgi:hypothetical protein